MNSVLQQVAIPAVMQRANASGLFVSLCTIQQPDGVLIDAGQPSGNYINVSPTETWQANTLYSEGEEITVAGTVQRCAFEGLSGSMQPTFAATPGNITYDGLGALAWVCESAAMTNIPCTAPPMSSVRLQATEVRAMDDIQSFAPRHVLLNGFFPQIQQGVASGWIATIDGQVYTLLGAENDSQSQMTRLAVRFGAV